jgi:hypothetical protein
MIFYAAAVWQTVFIALIFVSLFVSLGGVENA